MFTYTVVACTRAAAVEARLGLSKACLVDSTCSNTFHSPTVWCWTCDFPGSSLFMVVVFIVLCGGNCLFLSLF